MPTHTTQIQRVESVGKGKKMNNWNTALVNDGKIVNKVEMVAVRHGHWIRSEDEDDGYCSVCHCDMPMYREDWKWKYTETPFCPNCGAKMDEVEDAETN